MAIGGTAVVFSHRHDADRNRALSQTRRGGAPLLFGECDRPTARTDFAHLGRYQERPEIRAERPFYEAGEH
jgi:hypothetical protein